ncbi:hypothetical protein VTH06DRAFT_5516 [Thermothelomyces fergusii]
MATNKRRKLDGGGSSTPTAMSAFAARQQLWELAAARHRGGSVSEPATEDEVNSEKAGTSSAGSVAGRSRKSRPPNEAKPGGAKQVQEIEGEETGDVGSGTSTPGPGPSGMVIRQHSSFKPSKTNFQKKTGGRSILTTREGERLVILGSYGVKVCEGEATLAGAILTPSDPIQWVHAPHCHAVPVLRTADDTVLELRSHPAAKELRQLAALNPVFARLWNECPSEKSTSKPKPSATFQIIYTSQDVPKRAMLQELTSPPEWNKKLSALVTTKRRGTPVIFLCGPKSSGKSTFGRLLANRFITDRGGVKNRPWTNVAVLDIDPGQPEYSPPGVISLVKIATPNLSPSFCHPTLTPSEGQLRAHAIASVTPALDPAHFVECVLDLFAQYQRGPYADSPLVINTPGWIQGTGLDILTELITSIRPTEVIYMSQEGPEETVDSLRAACAATTPSVTFTTLPSQSSEPSSRTALHLRTMQTMSYFHLRRQPGIQEQQSQIQPYQTWDSTPITDLRPWRVRYAGKNRGILGILCYDHQPAPSLLAEAINGTVLALVGLESRDALRDLRYPLRPRPATPTSNDEPAPPSTEARRQQQQEEEEDDDDGGGGGDQLPLIPNPHSRTLSPRHSRLLGLVLLRAVDTARRELQLLTPLDVGAVLAGPGRAGADGTARWPSAEDLVLVAGRFDTPTWAYSEWLCRSRARDAAAGGSETETETGGESEDEEDGSDGGAGLEGRGQGHRAGGDRAQVVVLAGNGDGRQGGEAVPWVEALHGSQKRAVGSKVWRVRRDLGRN